MFRRQARTRTSNAPFSLSACVINEHRLHGFHGTIITPKVFRNTLALFSNNPALLLNNPALLHNTLSLLSEPFTRSKCIHLRNYSIVIAHFLETML